MRHTVSELEGMALITLFCGVLVLLIAGSLYAQEDPEPAPVPEKISVVQLLHQQHQTSVLQMVTRQTIFLSNQKL